MWVVTFKLGMNSKISTNHISTAGKILQRHASKNILPRSFFHEKKTLLLTLPLLLERRISLKKNNMSNRRTSFFTGKSRQIKDFLIPEQIQNLQNSCCFNNKVFEYIANVPRMKRSLSSF